LYTIRFRTSLTKAKDNQGKMPFTEGDIIEGFESFQSQIKTLEKDQSKQPLYILFTGSDGPDGKSWCPDCIVFENAWGAFKKKNPPEEGCLIRVKVGPRDFWKDKGCPFRTEKSLKLTSVPTLVRWGTPKRLQDDQIVNPDLLTMLLEDD